MFNQGWENQRPGGGPGLVCYIIGLPYIPVYKVARFRDCLLGLLSDNRCKICLKKIKYCSHNA